VQPYSTQVLAWLAQANPTPFVVPDTNVLVVRDIDVNWGGGAVVNWVAGIDGVSTFAGGAFTAIDARQFQSWRGRQVVLPGQTFYVTADAVIDGQVSGYLLGFGT